MHSVPSLGKGLLPIRHAFVDVPPSRILDSNTTDILVKSSAIDAAHLGSDGRRLSASIQGYIRQLALFTELQLEDLNTIELTFTSLYTPTYKEKALVSRIRAQTNSLWWHKLGKVLDEEDKLLDTVVKWLDEALSLIHELQFHLQAVRDGLVDVERHYQEVELTGDFSRTFRLERSLAAVNASLNQISTVVKSVQ